jgi:hypothetical protein
MGWDVLALFNKTIPVHMTKMQEDALTPDTFIFKVSSILMGERILSGRLQTHWLEIKCNCFLFI